VKFAATGIGPWTGWNEENWKSPQAGRESRQSGNARACGSTSTQQKNKSTLSPGRRHAPRDRVQDVSPSGLDNARLNSHLGVPLIRLQVRAGGPHLQGWMGRGRSALKVCPIGGRQKGARRPQHSDLRGPVGWMVGRWPRPESWRYGAGGVRATARQVQGRPGRGAGQARPNAVR
jgi:hypothetical protein